MTTKTTELDLTKLPSALATEVAGAIASFDTDSPLAGEKLAAVADRLF
jgi:hypothetical protein